MDISQGSRLCRVPCASGETAEPSHQKACELRTIGLKFMKKICIIFLALLALPVFAVSADLERGGVSFDFASISAERFAVDASRNMVKEPVSGVVTGSFEKVFHLPKTDAATWRVSLRYRMRHAKAGASLFKVVPGPW